MSIMRTIFSYFDLRNAYHDGDCLEELAASKKALTLAQGRIEALEEEVRLTDIIKMLDNIIERNEVKAQAHHSGFELGKASLLTYQNDNYDICPALKEMCDGTHCEMSEDCQLSGAIQNLKEVVET